MTCIDCYAEMKKEDCGAWMTCYKCKSCNIGLTIEHYDLMSGCKEKNKYNWLLPNNVKLSYVEDIDGNITQKEVK